MVQVFQGLGYSRSRFFSVQVQVLEVALLNSFSKIQKQLSKGVLKIGVLKICSNSTGEHPCRSVISIKLQGNFIKITFRHGCS